MAILRVLRSQRAALLASAAYFVFAVPAASADLPATPEGASTLADVFKTYFGSTPSVTPQGQNYIVTFALQTPAAFSGNANMKFEPVKIALKLFQQDDGAWRAEMSDLPPISMSGEVDNHPLRQTVNFSGFKQVAVFDPASAAVRNSEFSADKIAIEASFPNGSENVEVVGMKGMAAGRANAEGGQAFTIRETFENFNLKVAVDPKTDAKPGTSSEPMSLSGKAGPISADVKFDGLKSKPLLDLWAFMTAHPQRADLAANESTFKALLTAVASGEPSFSETAQSGAGSFSTTKGGLAFDKVALGASGGMKGAQSRFEERVALSGIALSEGLVDPNYKPLIPTSLDIGFKLSGFDLTSAVQEAIADLKLVGEGPWLDKDGKEKVGAKLMAAGPIALEITGSHILAPVLDLTLDGHAEYRIGGKPVGKATIRMRNFDQTVAALKGLGAEVEQKLVPMLAMAKGLSKADGDALIWVCELGADRIMKINGLPLGKAPI